MACCLCNNNNTAGQPIEQITTSSTGAFTDGPRDDAQDQLQPPESPSPLEPPIKADEADALATSEPTVQVEVVQIDSDGPIGPGTEFTLNVKKPASGLGLRLVEAANLDQFPCMVRDADNGPLAGKVEKYDRIIDINGVSGPLTKLAEEIQNNTALAIRVRKAKPYTVAIKKTLTEQLGLTLDPIAQENTAATDELDKGEEFFIITDIIFGSPVHRLNKQYADRAIRKSDWVVEVNGASGCKLMLEQIKNSTELKIKFVRQFRTAEINAKKI